MTRLSPAVLAEDLRSLAEVVPFEPRTILILEQAADTLDALDLVRPSSPKNGDVQSFPHPHMFDAARDRWEPVKPNDVAALDTPPVAWTADETDHDRVELNQQGNWTGPDYAQDLLDELVISDALVHYEATDDASAYLTATTATRQVFVRLHARPTTRQERRQILAGDGNLCQHLSGLLPDWLGGRSYWSVPWWQRPASVIRSWRDDVHAARAVLCADVEEDDDLEVTP